MASALLELRKAAGYRTAAEFADAVGIPASTYARYESNPDKIPMEPARRLADRLGVPIDVVVGREEVDVRSLRGDVQREYDALSEESKVALDRFLAFLLHADTERRRREEDEEERRWDELALRYEAMWHRELDERGELEDLVAFGTREEMREGFEAFVRDRAEARRERTGGDAVDEQSVKRIMAAYNRTRGGAGIPSFSFGRAPVAAEYDGAREGGARGA